MSKLSSRQDIISHIENNDLEILQSKKCSCLFCRHTMDAREVQDWVSNESGVSAICPECGMSALIGDASGITFTKEELKELNLKYFGDDYMERHPEAAMAYCQRYHEGKITNKASNELLYIQYLNVLSRQGDPDATFELASLLEFGSEFTEPDPKTAFSYYAAKCLQSDGAAYVRMGVLCESGVLGKKDFRGAFECYAKAMAFASALGIIHFADCYLNGVYVTRNPSIAFDIFSNFYPDCYSRFVSTIGQEPLVFASLCYRLGLMYHQGLGVEQSSLTAIRFLLMADRAFVIQGESEMNGDVKADFNDCFRRINEIAFSLGYKPSQPSFDNDTFAETFSLNPFANKGGLDGSRISDIKYDKETQTLELVTYFGLPQLIIDTASLFVGFVGKNITWVFSDVVDVRFPTTDGPIWFDRCYGDGDEGFRFCLSKDGGEEVVAEFVLSAPESAPIETASNNDKQKGQA